MNNVRYAAIVTANNSVWFGWGDSPMDTKENLTSHYNRQSHAKMEDKELCYTELE